MVTRFLLLQAAIQVSFVATASANIPVFEAYAGARPKKVDAMAAFLAEIERLPMGFLVSPKRIQSSLGSHVPLPGSDPAGTAAEFTKKLDLADAAWIRQPALEELLPTLAAAVDIAKNNPAYFVAGPSRRDVFRRVLLAYALTLRRGGNVRESEDTMSEWIRTFPDQVVTRAHDGSDAEQLYLETRKTLSRRGRGTLMVNLTDISLQLYVNEVIHRAGMPIVDLFPGLYRILVVDRYNKSRRYTIEVLANQDSVLSIDWSVDSALRMSPSYAAFEFATSTELAQSGPAIARFVASTVGAPGVILVEPSKSERGQIITAEVYSAERTSAVRGGWVSLTGDARTDGARATALARYVVLREESPEVTVSVRAADSAGGMPTVSGRLAVNPTNTATDSGMEAGPPVSVFADQTPSRAQVVPGILITGGVALVAGGIYLQSRSTRIVEGRNVSQAVSEVSKTGIAMDIAGGAILGIGIGWMVATYVSHPPSAAKAQRTLRGTAIRVVPLAGGGEVRVFGRF